LRNVNPVVEEGDIGGINLIRAGGSHQGQRPLLERQVPIRVLRDQPSRMRPSPSYERPPRPPMVGDDLLEPFTVPLVELVESPKRKLLA
jgi:hypothetical protein